MLPEARRRLSTIVAGLDSLQAETAWECRAADEYRASLDGLIGELRELRGACHELEADLRALWHRAVTAGAC